MTRRLLVAATGTALSFLSVARSDVVAHRQGGFHEVKIGTEDSSLLVKNSVLLVGGFLSCEECRLLVTATETAHRKAEEAEEGDEDERAERRHIHRIPVRDLEASAQELSSRILQERVLPFLEHWLPGPCLELFGRSAQLHALTMVMASDEPSVNRYTAGGEFPGHVDGYAVTVVIPLNDPSVFHGGGRGFWPCGTTAGDQGAAVEVHINPSAGTAILFSGDLRHAGKPVTHGIRYLYVASFDLT